MTSIGTKKKTRWGSVDCFEDCFEDSLFFKVETFECGQHVLCVLTTFKCIF